MIGDERPIHGRKRDADEREVRADMKRFYEDERRRAEARIRNDLRLNERQIKNAIYRLRTGRIKAGHVLTLDGKEAQVYVTVYVPYDRESGPLRCWERPGPVSDGWTGLRTVDGRSSDGHTSQPSVAGV